MGLAHQDFLEDLCKLCEKHSLVIVPTYGGEPSAHDPMTVLPIDDFWRDYLRERTLIENHE